MVVNWMPQVVPNARRGKAKPSKLLFPLSIPNRRGRERGLRAYSAMARQPQSRRAVVAQDGRASRRPISIGNRCLYICSGKILMNQSVATVFVGSDLFATVNSRAKFVCKVFG